MWFKILGKMDGDAHAVNLENVHSRSRSSYLSVASSVISRRSSLYDSIASLNLNISGLANLDALQIEDIVAKNREISDFISNRLTSLIYFSSELAGRQGQCRSDSIGEYNSGRISEDTKEYLENEETLPTETVFVKDICERLVKLSRCYEEKERHLEKNKKEIKTLEDELAELNDGLVEFVKSTEETKLDEKGVHYSCRCEIF